MTTPTTTDEERIGALEGELAAALQTIAILSAQLERTAGQPAELPEPLRDVVRIARAADEAARELSAVRAALGALRAELDHAAMRGHRALVESESQLRKKTAALERQDSANADFIANAAHQLRSPLTSIVGYLDLLSEGRFGDLPPLIDRPMSSVQRTAHRLTRLVEDMLDVSRLGGGGMMRRRGPVDLGGVVTDVVTELEPLAKARGQRVATHIEPVEAIDADRDKLHQIVVSLVSNAIRYTPEHGKIVIDVDEAPPDRHPGGWVRLRVRDNGVGIAEEDRKRIFDPFLHAHSAKHHTSAAPDSAGLALYIARGLVELHGGQITVDSRPNVFTEFTVLLPFKHDPQRDAEPPRSR